MNELLNVDLYKISELAPPVLLSVVLYGIATVIKAASEKMFDEASKAAKVYKGIIPLVMFFGGAAIYPWIYDRDIILDVNYPGVYAAIVGAGIGSITVAVYEGKKKILEMLGKRTEEKK